MTKRKNKTLITPSDKDNISGDKIYSVASTCKRALRFDLENHSQDAGCCTQKETMNFLAEKHPCLSNEQNRLPEQNLIEYVPNRTSHCTQVLEEQEQIALGPTSRHGTAPTKSEGTYLHFVAIFSHLEKLAMFLYINSFLVEQLQELLSFC